MGELFNQNQIELAWAAGFIDGEGCITTSKNRGNYTILLDVAQVNQRPLLRLQAILGGKVAKRKDIRGFHFQWRLYGPAAIEACKKILPFLSNKDRQAQLAIEFQLTIQGPLGKGHRLSIETLAKREAIRAEFRVLNHRRSLLKVSAERLNEGAPTTQSDDAIVRSHANGKHENVAEMTTSVE